MKKMKKGWMFCVLWKDNTTAWERLSKLKESNQVGIAEYAMGNKIHLEPAFKWWVSFTLNKRDRIISAVINCFHIRNHKFGIKLPKSVYDARHIDKENRNTLWEDAIKKEMKAVQVTFKMLNGEERAPPTYQQI